MKFQFGLLLLLIIVDRVTKELIYTLQPSNLFGGFVVTAFNPYQAFSLMWSPYIVWPLTIALIIYCSYQSIRFYQLRDTLFVAWSLIVVGAISNIMDRLLYGAVIDFINIQILPVFNLSDSMIVIGVGWLLVAEYFASRNKKLSARRRVF